MRSKELERGDPSEYAFGVKCSATLSGRRHRSARKEPPQRVIYVWNWYYRNTDASPARGPSRPSCQNPQRSIHRAKAGMGDR